MPRREFMVALSLLCVGLPADVRADYWSDNGCVLDKPKSVFRRGGFNINEKTGLATETLALNESVTVRLEQTACEYQSRTYIFISKEVRPDLNVVGWQYRKAVELFSLLEAVSNPKLKFAKEKQTLQAYEQLVSDPKDDVDLNAIRPQSDISEYISLRSQTGESGIKIIVKTWSGPY